MSEKTIDLVVLKHANFIVPVGYQKKIVEVFGESGVISAAYTFQKDGVKDFVIEHVLRDNFKEQDTFEKVLVGLMGNESKKYQMLYHIQMPSTSQIEDDAQPFPVVKDRQGLPLAVSSIVGNLEQWDKSATTHTQAYYAWEELKDKMKDVYEDICDSDIEKFFTRLTKTREIEDILRIVNNDGAIITLGMNGLCSVIASPEYQFKYDWGIVTDNLRYGESEQPTQVFGKEEVDQLKERFKVIEGDKDKKTTTSVPVTKTDGPTAADAVDITHEVKEVTSRGLSEEQEKMLDKMLHDAKQTMIVPPADLKDKPNKNKKGWYKQHFGFAPMNNMDPTKHFDALPPLPAAMLKPDSSYWKKWSEDWNRKNMGSAPVAWIDFKNMKQGARVQPETPTPDPKAAASSVGPSIETVGPIFSNKELEAFKDDILPKILGHGGLEIDDPNKIQASEKKVPSFVEQTGLKLEDTLNWKFESYELLASKSPRMAAKLLCDRAFYIMKRMPPKKPDLVPQEKEEVPVVENKEEAQKEDKKSVTSVLGKFRF